MTDVAPNIDYTSRDYDGLRQSLLDYARVAFPDWQPASEGDFGVLMVELLAYTGDILSYYVDRAQIEAYLPTATQRSSVLQIAQLLGYQPNTGAPATGTVTLRTTSNGTAVAVPAGTLLATGFVDSLDGPIYYETDIPVTVPGEGGTTVVPVTEGETKKDPTSGGPLRITEANGNTNQVYRLPNPRVYEETVRVFVAGEEWLPVNHLLDAEPNSRVFSVYTDATSYTWIQFGDGLNGAIPGIGLVIEAFFRVGVGATGNVPAGQVINIVAAIPNLSIQTSAESATESTSTAMGGGADPESIEQIRTNAPRAFAAQQRAITLEDYADFALGVPGVAKANAVANFFSSVTTYVVGPDGGTPSDTLLDRVQGELDRRSLAGVTASVGSPTFVAINAGSSGSPIAVHVWNTYSRTGVQFNVEQAIKTMLSFTERSLGDRLTVAEFYSRIMEIDGVRYVDIPLLARADAAQSGTADIQLLPWEFPKVGEIVVTSSGGIG